MIETHTNSYLFFNNDPPPTDLYTLSLHDALPILSVLAARSQKHLKMVVPRSGCEAASLASRKASINPLTGTSPTSSRSEEHTSELQSPYDLVCRLLLEKKKHNNQPSLYNHTSHHY